MNGHFITYCSCGEVISQCRCMSCNKTVTTIVNGCKECKEKLKKENIEFRGGFGRMKANKNPYEKTIKMIKIITKKERDKDCLRRIKNALY